MAACDILETFEDVVGNWSVTVDESGTGSVTRSSTYAHTGTYSASCYTTASGDVAQCRVVNSDVTNTHRWLNAMMYIPSATVSNLTGSEYMEIAGWWPSAGGNYGWWLQIQENGAMYARGYEPDGPSEVTFDIFGTIPTDEWFELEIGLATSWQDRAFSVIVNGDFYGWYDKGNSINTEDFNRVAVGILNTNSVDDLTVYVDQFREVGTTTETPCGTDNRQTGDLVAKDFRDESGVDWVIDWYTFNEGLVLDSTYGLYAAGETSPRLQCGINHANANSLDSGWAWIKIGWPAGTPTTDPSTFFGPMIAFRKSRPNEENLEIIPYGNGDGTVTLRFESWTAGANVIDTWAMPAASIGGGSHIPESGDIIFVRWEEKGSTNLLVIVDYYDASASTWYNNAISIEADVSDEGGVNFRDSDHLQVTNTIDSGEYSIVEMQFGTLTSAPRKRLTTDNVDTNSSNMVGGVTTTTYTRATIEIETDVAGAV